MTLSPPKLHAPRTEPSPQPGLAAMQAELQKLERRDWWLWGMAAIVMLVLTFAVFAMSFPGLIKVEDPFFEASLNRAVRGLIGLVLIFNAYTIYQQTRPCPPSIALLLTIKDKSSIESCLSISMPLLFSPDGLRSCYKY